MYELINDVQITVKEYNGQRVVTFKDIDRVHNRPAGTAGRNFRANREHFIEGEDFYKITPDEFRRTIGYMDSRQSNDVILITLSGYLMLVKSFTDDLSWSVQRQLVKTYFKVQEISTFYNGDIYKRLETLENKIDSLHKETRKLNKKFKNFIKSSEQNTEKIIVKSVSETAKSLVPYFDTSMKVILGLLRLK